MVKAENQDKALTQAGLVRVLTKLVKESGNMKISVSDLDSMSDDERLMWRYLPEDDAFEFEVKKIKMEKNNIVAPKRSLILPGN